MESLLLAASLKDRSSFDLITEHINPKKYSAEFNVVMGKVDEYYHIDKDARSVNAGLLVQSMTETVRAEKHLAKFKAMVEEAQATTVDISTENIKHVVLLAKRQELGDELAVAITNGKEHTELLEKYTAIQEATTLDAYDEAGLEVYDSAQLLDLVTSGFSGEGVLMTYPPSLAKKLDGGLREGHHMVVFAQPEVGKTGEVITLAAGFGHGGHEGVIFTNEERPADITLRLIQCLSGRTKHQCLENMREAYDIAVQRGLGRITVITAAPGTPKQIERVIKEYRPKWFILDQLRNVAIKNESRVNQLEQAATFLRTMAKKYHLVMISVTQAGDSASGKAVLEMGDVDSSNTGIPASCDVLLGIGGTKEQIADGIRVFSLCKNKVGAAADSHEAFPVRFHSHISKYVDV